MGEFSKKGKVQRKSDGTVLFSDCAFAQSALERMVGLLSKSQLNNKQALWISPCTSIHTFFMRFSIDAAFLNKEGRVIAVYEALKPWRFSFIHFRAIGVLEAKAGSFQALGLKKGEVLEICPSS